MEHLSLIFLFFFLFAIRKKRHGAVDDADRFETVSFWDISREDYIYALFRAG